MTVTTLMTADELLRLPDDGWRYELVRGELRKMSPSGARHARVAAQIIGSLIAFLKGHPIGTAYASEAGFRISRTPDTVRAPDAAFVRADRVVDTPGFFDGPPDVAFEVTSPGDTYSEVEEKTLAWLRAGVLAVVIVDPRTSTVRIHRTSGATNVTEAIEVDDVIPGWKLPLSEVFA
ncbi:MAG TPA: Uma2 family endonuclease [Thermoanaerobaculia bacterium]|jgi:Uma2 family endonuclease|nr:Uma2 family endonuclease [Thermoanaerobaculia bacterium]